MLARWFIDRPIAANVIAIVTMLLGAVAIFRLPIEQYPQITPGTVKVTTNYPGAMLRSSPIPWPPRSSSGSTASKKCSTCPRRRPTTAPTP